MSSTIGKSIGLCLGIVLLLAGILLLFRLKPTDPAEERTVSAEDSAGAHDAGWILTVWNDRLAIFAPGAPEPYELYDVNIAALPEEEQMRLRSGVIVQRRRELESLLEDYTS